MNNSHKYIVYNINILAIKVSICDCVKILTCVNYVCDPQWIVLFARRLAIE